MQANWSLILNVLLLFGVLITIGLLMRARKQSLSSERIHPNVGIDKNSLFESANYNDDIIAVRKLSAEPEDLAVYDETAQALKKETSFTQPKLFSEEIQAEPIPVQHQVKISEPSSLMMFLLAKENRQFAGYELLQTVLAAGLRFGEGHLFHRHQYANGQGPVLCSLAAATQTGVFDLQNIGGFSVRGLCLFMHASKNPGIDKERFTIMLETAQQLKEGLDAHLLDFQKKPLTEERIAHYWSVLQVDNSQLETANA